jgi:predicted regulator of Ras-like GTPase activity (Roadblock/LC7/MglB family)
MRGEDIGAEGRSPERSVRRWLPRVAAAACASVGAMEAAEALAELKELSTQIEVVCLATRSGDLVASTMLGQAGVKLARLAADIVTQADTVRSDLGREPLAQLQAATPDGCLFVVLDGDQLAVATTGADPTVGLIFYDLKTLLRQLGRDDGEAAAAPAEAAPVATEEEAGGDA